MPKSGVGTPITITLYNSDDSVKAEYSRIIVPWGILKRVMKLVKGIDLEHPESISEDDIDAISGLVVELFGNQFNITDLDDGADVVDMISVLQAVMTKASGVAGNPTPPAK